MDKNDYNENEQEERIFDKISNHALERYAERIMEYDNAYDINSYIQKNKDKIIERINKLYKYSQFLYYGKTSSNNEYRNFYIKDTWVLVVSKNKKDLITLFEIDFGLGEDFNKDFINKSLEKLISLKCEYDSIKVSNDNENKEYYDEITYNRNKITQLKSMIKEYESRNEILKKLIETQNVKLFEKESEIKGTINTLIRKKYL